MIRRKFLAMLGISPAVAAGASASTVPAEAATAEEKQPAPFSGADIADESFIGVVDKGDFFMIYVGDQKVSNAESLHELVQEIRAARQLQKYGVMWNDRAPLGTVHGVIS